VLASATSASLLVLEHPRLLQVRSLAADVGLENMNLVNHRAKTNEEATMASPRERVHVIFVLASFSYTA
jgi:hypothetical protein